MNGFVIIIEESYGHKSYFIYSLISKKLLITITKKIYLLSNKYVVLKDTLGKVKKRTLGYD